MSDPFFPPLASWFEQRTIDAIEVVALMGHMNPPSAGQPGLVVGARVFACGRSRVLDVAERANCVALLRGLPESDVARCHMPGFGLRVTSGADLVGVSLCYECANAYVGARLHSFAPDSLPAAALRAFFESLRIKA